MLFVAAFVVLCSLTVIVLTFVVMWQESRG